MALHDSSGNPAWTRFKNNPSHVLQGSGGDMFFDHLGRLMSGAAEHPDCAGARDVTRLEADVRDEAKAVLAEVASLGAKVKAVADKHKAIIGARHAARRRAEAEARSNARAAELKAERIARARELAGAIVEAGESLEELPEAERRALTPLVGAMTKTSRGRR